MDVLKVKYVEHGTGTTEKYDLAELLDIHAGEIANANNIGVAGNTWLGTGWVDPAFVPDFLNELPGTRKTDHPDSGNYVDLDGGKWVCLPITWFRRIENTGELELSCVSDGTYKVHPAFIINGVPRKAIFVMKYPASFEKINGANRIVSKPFKPPIHYTRVDIDDYYSFSTVVGDTVGSIAQLNPFLQSQEMIPLTIYAAGLIAILTNILRNSVSPEFLAFSENQYPSPVNNYDSHCLFRQDPKIGYTGTGNRMKHDTHNGMYSGISDINLGYTYLSGLRQLSTTYSMFNVNNFDIRTMRNNLSAYIDMPVDSQNGYGYLGYRKSGPLEFYDPSTSTQYWLASGANLPRREAISTEMAIDPLYGSSLVNTYHTSIAEDPFFALSVGEYGLFLDYASFNAVVQRKTIIRYMTFSKK